MIQYQTTMQSAAAKIAARPRCRQTIISRLADVICEMAGSGEVITTEALILRGFSTAIVARHGEAARSEARRRFIRSV